MIDIDWLRASTWHYLTSDSRIEELTSAPQSVNLWRREECYSMTITYDYFTASDFLLLTTVRAELAATFPFSLLHLLFIAPPIFSAAPEISAVASPIFSGAARISLAFPRISQGKSEHFIRSASCSVWHRSQGSPCDRTYQETSE